MMGYCLTTRGETLCGDRSNLFGIKRCANIKISPVAAIERYMATTRAMKVDLTDGFLFRPTTAQGAIPPLFISSEAMNGRLGTYPREAAMDEGETAHSFRPGCAITLALSGSVLADVMTHVGWERSDTASYYMQLEKVLHHDSTSALLGNTKGEGLGWVGHVHGLLGRIDEYFPSEVPTHPSPVMISFLACAADPPHCSYTEK